MSEDEVTYEAGADVDAPSLRTRLCVTCGEPRRRSGFVGDQCAECAAQAAPIAVETSTQRQCAACGTVKFHFQFVRGGTICKSCQAQVDLLAAEQSETQALEPEGEPDLRTAVHGTVEDQRWLADVCGRSGEEQGPLTLADLRAALTAALEDCDQAIARATEVATRRLEPSRIPLETAAQCLYLKCYPEIKERWDAVREHTGLPLWRLFISNWAYHKDDLGGQDPVFVPEATQQEQYGRGGLRMVPAPGGSRVLVGEESSQGLCQCCGVPVTPTVGRPHPAYCQAAPGDPESECGNYVAALSTWVRNAIRTPDMEGVPLPDPLRYLRPERCTGELLARVRAYGAAKVEELRPLVEREYKRMRGVS